MSQEILYTSAPRGLKPGSRGFCTVVSTYGMSKTLAERLESLSGYRHAFLPPDPNTRYNPVNYSHLMISVGGRKYHVLSRIGDAGMDYTNRTNKLAHHVALEESEILACRQGPAELLAQDGFCETAWDGQTNARRPGRIPQPGAAVARVCSTWAALTGDAGWAGVLAESALGDRRRPISVIFSPGTDTLALIIEAISLLPADQRWSIAFSTYFTKLPAGVDCFWRFLVDGSPEAQAVRRNPHLPVIDLCATLRAPDDSEAVTAARLGRVIGEEQSSMATRNPLVMPPIPGLSQGKTETAVEDRPLAEAEVYGIQPPCFPGEYGTGSRIDTGTGSLGLGGVVGSARKSRRNHFWTVAALALSGVIVLLLVVAAWLLLGKTMSTESAASSGVGSAVSTEQPPSQPQAETSPAPAHKGQQEDSARARHDDSTGASSANAARKSPEPKATGEPADPETSRASRKENIQDSVATGAVLSTMAEQTAGSPTVPLGTNEPQGANSDGAPVCQREDGILELPDPSLPQNAGGRESKLACVPADPADYSLALLGSQIAVPKRSGVRFALEPVRNVKGPLEWCVRATIENTLASDAIARLRISQESLMFKWEPRISRSLQPDRLRYCVLEIRSGDERKQWPLTRPEEITPASLRADAGKFEVQPALMLAKLPDTEHLRFDFRIAGLEGYDTRAAEAIVISRTASIIVYQPGVPESRRFLDLRLRPHTAADKFSVEVQLMSHQTWLQGRSKIVKEDLISRISLGDLTTKCSKDGQTYEKELATISEERQQALRTSAGDRDSKLEELKTRKSDALMGKQLADQNKVWCDNMRGLLSQLESHGRIHLRVFIEIGGQEVDVVRTQGFPGIRSTPR